MAHNSIFRCWSVTDR